MNTVRVLRRTLPRRHTGTASQHFKAIPPLVQYANERNDSERFGDFVIRAEFVTATPAGNRFHKDVELASDRLLEHE